MRELPRELTAEELAELFEGRTRFVERLAGEPDPLARARTLVHELPDDEKREILDAHPAIGKPTGLSKRSAAEQGTDVDPAVLAELHRLNADYERRHGFRFVVFVEPAPEGGDPGGAPQPDRQPDRGRARDRARRARRHRGGSLGARETLTAAFPLALSDALRDWLDLGLRWLHVIAAMAWIGTSFYFVLLDQSLRPPKDPADADAGVGGELWEVHGGGFYHVQKYVVAPRVLPDHLAWFKWEAYTTWLSGFGLMLVLYYLEASSALVKPGDDLEPWLAVTISIGLLAVAWIVYDVLNRLVSDARVLWPVLFVLVALAAWASSELFSPRAAWLQVGAMIGTVMAANVFFDIIPAHRELIRAKEAGREPDPGRASRRSSARSRTTTSRCRFC